MRIAVATAVLMALGLALWRFWPQRLLSDAEFAALYATPLAPLETPLAVYHLGHSLVGRDMPAMLAQLAGHSYNSQLGWGASLMNHWTGDIPGFAEENLAHAFRPAGEALDSGTYPAVVLTEMVELRDAIRWHDSATFLAKWAERAKAANPDTRVYLYETWHRLDDPEGWEARIASDRTALWEEQVLRPAVATTGVIYVIPGGQVMAALVVEAEAGRLPGLTNRNDLFSDEIHFNDLGAYAMALTHYAVITGRSPVGLPHSLRRADGSAAKAPAPATARAMQEVVWRVVTGYLLAGVAKGD
jgi:hypothetical protein